jgi:hypothetical protein
MRTISRTHTRGMVVALWCLVGCGRVASNTGSDIVDRGARQPAADASPEAGKPRCVFAGFADAVTYVAAHEALSLAVVDRTRTGHLDIVVGERIGLDPDTTEFLVNAGDGTFSSSTSYPASSIAAATLVTADFDGDGRVDLASTSNGMLAIELGAGHGFAAAPVTYPTPETGGALTVGDYNGDGHPDVAFLGHDTVERTGPGLGLPGPEDVDFALNVFLNHGDGSFGPPDVFPNPLSTRTAVSGDFDGDGAVDIAELGATNGGGFQIFYNAGGGRFTSPVAFVARRPLHDHHARSEFAHRGQRSRSVQRRRPHSYRAGRLRAAANPDRVSTRHR